MLTPIGVYVLNVLAMGLSSAHGLFESALWELLEGLAGVVNIADDIQVFGAAQEEHDSNVISYLERCLEVDLKLNVNKVKLNCKEIPFFRQCVTALGIKPNPANVYTIQCWPILTKFTELMSFLGCVNYLSRFMPELRALQQPLQSPVKVNTEYIWLSHHTDAFEKIKDAVSQDCLIQFYDVSKPLFIEPDASKKGLGCILLQPVSGMDEKDIANTSKMNDFLSGHRPVVYASKSFSNTETHYVSIERELLGVVFGVEHFKHSTYGHHIHIITDHKPLLALLNPSLIQPLVYQDCHYPFQSMI